MFTKYLLLLTGLTLSFSLFANKYNVAPTSENTIMSSDATDASVAPAEGQVKYAYFRLAAGSMVRNYGKYVFRLEYTVTPSGQVNVNLTETQKVINGYNGEFTKCPTAFAGRYTKSKIPEFSTSSSADVTTVTIDWRYYDNEAHDPFGPDTDSGTSTIKIDKTGSWVDHEANSWLVPESNQGLKKIPFVTAQ
ncbi:MAG: hypothetical protein WCQ53_03810 [bacterium]